MDDGQSLSSSSASSTPRPLFIYGRSIAPDQLSRVLCGSIWDSSDASFCIRRARVFGWSLFISFSRNGPPIAVQTDEDSWIDGILVAPQDRAQCRHSDECMGNTHPHRVVVNAVIIPQHAQEKPEEVVEADMYYNRYNTCWATPVPWNPQLLAERSVPHSGMPEEPVVRQQRDSSEETLGHSDQERGSRVE